MGDDKAVISIFAAEPSYRKSNLLKYPHIIRGSSMIRGQQVAAALGARLNPKDGYEDDVCIHVKPNSLDRVRDRDWVDLVDGRGIIPLLRDRPKIRVIAVSECSLEMYRKMGMANEAVIIRPHHCNFDRVRRDRRRVRTVGYIGSEVAFRHPLEDFKERINAIELNFIWSVDYKAREDVVDFYRRIDIQLVWSSPKFGRQSIGPTKAVNAASFGIPTVAYPQVCYGEIQGKYIEATMVEDAIREIEWLKDSPGHYDEWACRTEWTEDYHIDSIAKLYRSL
jgi:hypothetical protein